MSEQSTSTETENSGWMKSNSMLPGLGLILFGSIFLVGNLTGFRLDNWWALFILFPAFGSISAGWSRYRKIGSFDGFARKQLFSSLFLILLSLTFLLNLDFGKIWPAFLILSGFGILFGAGNRE